MSDLNSWVSPLFKDTCFFQIEPLVQEIWFWLWAPPLFSQNFLETDHPTNEKFQIWGFRVGGQN